MNGKKDMVVFVKLDDYQEIQDVVGLIRDRIKQARYLINNVSELKRKEDTEIETMSSELNNVEEKVGAINRVLSEPEM